MSEDAPVQTLAAGACRKLVPLPAPDANKYSRGVLAVVGGSAAYPGAPIMAARAAMRAGAGYARLFVPEQAAQTARAHLLSIPVEACTQTACGSFDPECADTLIAAAAKADAFAVGPGMGTSASAAEFFVHFLQALHDRGDTRPILFDADALNVLAAHPELSSLRAGCDDVLTPHEGEAARLLGRRVADRLADARELAGRYGATVVLKGPRTLIVGSDGRAAVHVEAGPELAKAGTGDVLAGIVGALCAQGLCGFDAGCLGVFVHGRAGSLAAREMSVVSVVAEDIIESIGPAFVSMGA